MIPKRHSYGMASETQRRRSLHERIFLVMGVLLLYLLIVVARLLELQLVRGASFSQWAEQKHFAGVKLPAKRGEILGTNSKTGELTIFATNTTLDLVYVDPSASNDKDPKQLLEDKKLVARTLADTLLTQEFHDACSHGAETCPRELIKFYAAAFDPVKQHQIRNSGSILEPLPPGPLPPKLLKLPSLVEARDLFMNDIQERISSTRVTFVPLKYGSTKVEEEAVQKLNIPGVQVDTEDHLISANPEEINQSLVDSFSESLAQTLSIDEGSIKSLLLSRTLRYVPIMRKVPRELSLKLVEQKTESAKQALKDISGSKRPPADPEYPLRMIALVPEHWRFYPDTTIASQVVGFLNTNQEAQYGIERTYNSQLRGEDGTINTANDLRGGQILRSEQKIQDPKDGDTVILTIDRAVQEHVEQALEAGMKQFSAESAQAIVMDPFTGKIVAMVNAPLFNSNNYADVYEREPITLDSNRQKKVVVEIYHPETHVLVVRDYIDHVLTGSGRTLLSEKIQASLSDLEKLYDLHDLSRYYLYVSNQSNYRYEVFPTTDPGVWLKFKNTVGVGAYLNRTVQEIYEPGSVMKPITMSIAIDQGEVNAMDTYEDFGPIDMQDGQKPINNNDGNHYGRVSMVQCLEYSINTCMSELGFKLGPKLLVSMFERFGFGKITSIELDDELAGEIQPWKGLPRRTLASMTFGQGISVTPLQMITAWSALANGGKLVRPIIVDSVIHEDGTREYTPTRVIDQVITPQTSDTITAMLVSSATRGFAKGGKVPGYRIAGKTGTSQIAGPGAQYETGTGSTVATYAGYAPVNRPRFVILVKIDRPKRGTHGAVAAAPIFKDIAAYLLRYYGIPPDDGNGSIQEERQRARQIEAEILKPLKKKDEVPRVMEKF